MGIRKYKIFDNDVKDRKNRLLWVPILKRGIKDVFKKKFAKLLFSFSLLPLVSFIVPLYISVRPELKYMLRRIKFLANDSTFFYAFFTNNLLIFILLLLSIFTGAELISRDFKSNAIPLYFARPISKIDYIKGKLSIILFYLLSFTLIPGLLLIVFKLLFSGQLVDFRIILSSVLYPVIIALFFSSYTLLISSFSNNEKFVKIAIFFIYLLSDIVFGIIHNILKTNYIGLISIRVNLKNFASVVFGTQSNFDFSGWYSGIFLIFLTIVFVIILYKRIDRVSN
jgi:ABC-type transport system involved in multi-copper enzyme maturation permease subunit